MLLQGTVLDWEHNGLLDDWGARRNFEFEGIQFEFPLELHLAERIYRCFGKEYKMIVEDSLVSKLKDLRKQGEIDESLKAGLDVNDIPQVELLTRLKKYQEAGVRYGIHKKNFLLLDEMGCGKTLESLAIFHHWKSIGEASKGIVICPNSLKFNWKNEIEKHTKYSFTIIEGTAAKREKLFKEKTDLYIISYDSATIEIIQLSKLADNQLLICDEAHYLKTVQAKRTRALLSLTPKFKILMTGTPIANRPEDIYVPMQFVKKSWSGWSEFERLYIKKGGPFNKIIGYDNQEDLSAKLASISIRRLKTEVLPELPPKIYETRIVEMGEEQRRIYAAMEEEVQELFRRVREDNEKHLECRGKLIRLSQIADGFESDGNNVKWILDSKKVKAVCDLAEEYMESGEKVVIWAKFIPSILAIAERLKAYKPLVVRGKNEEGGVMDVEERQKRVDLFQNNPEYKLFIGQINCGIGINLFAASKEIFFKREWAPSVNAQAEDRLHRHGQTKAVNIVSFFTEDSIDLKIEKMLKQKAEWANEIEGGVLRISNNFMEALLRETK